MHKKKLTRQLERTKQHIGAIQGSETNASVDSELSMLLFKDYELYRWQRNKLKYKLPYWDYRSLMVSRLDGPGSNIPFQLIDKAIAAERTGLKGFAYIDSGHSATKKGVALFEKFDESLLQLASMIEANGTMPVIQETTPALFAPGQCPNTAIYCGWYSVRNYIDAFEFVDGAIGYHIASFEAVNIREPNSRQWCPAMLSDGVTVTLGPVDEPYLASFPKPTEFFTELFAGYCLVEAFYRSKPYNSWQLLLIGDPLYTPFKNKVPAVKSFFTKPEKINHSNRN